jgi:hypothetical protein
VEVPEVSVGGEPIETLLRACEAEVARSGRPSAAQVEYYLTLHLFARGTSVKEKLSLATTLGFLASGKGSGAKTAIREDKDFDADFRRMVEENELGEAG